MVMSTGARTARDLGFAPGADAARERSLVDVRSLTENAL